MRQKRNLKNDKRIMSKVIKILVKMGEKVKINKVYELTEKETREEVEYRVVVEDGGQVDLAAKIVVGEKAVGSEGSLKIKVLLLGEGATAVVVPELEIMTNGVRAFHSASVGKIDEEQWYYLCSRGLSRAEAKKMIVKAFLA